MKIPSPILYYLVIPFFLMACSIQSTQINAVKNLISKPDNMILEPKWELNWKNKSVDVFAINAGKKIYFANTDNLLVEFEENQIKSIQNVIAKDDIIEIIKTGNKYNYYKNNNFLASSECNNWQFKVKNNDTAIYEQNCLYNKQTYFNKIIKNGNHEIVGLLFIIQPNFLSLELSLK